MFTTLIITTVCFTGFPGQLTEGVPFVVSRDSRDTRVYFFLSFCLCLG
jgi:hypothetical protein